MLHVNPYNLEKSEVLETDVVKAAGSLQYPNQNIKARAASLKVLSKKILEKRHVFAQAITKDIGKPLKQSLSEVDFAAQICAYYSSKAKILKTRKIDRHNYIQYEPIGIVGVISPWNYPVSTPLQSIAPALLAGNAVLHKPSEYAQHSSAVLDSIMQKAFPGCFGTVFGRGDAGHRILRYVDAVSFTGSVETGRKIMQGCAERVVKPLLELGGLDAALVLEDADIENAARNIVWWNTRNSGQVCSSVKRVFVHKRIYDKFLEACISHMKQLRLGNPMNDVDMGPLASQGQLKKVSRFYEDAIRKGASIEYRGEKPEKGYFFPPVILSNVTSDMILMQEEAFGPLLPIAVYEDLEEAITMINSTKYGLSASIWTKRNKELASRISVGVIGVNTHGPGPLGVPWGGTKKSGFGRLGWESTLLEFSNVKAVRLG